MVLISRNSYEILLNFLCEDVTFVAKSIIVFVTPYPPPPIKKNICSKTIKEIHNRQAKWSLGLQGPNFK